MKLLEKILFATDFSKSSNKAIKNAIGLAKIFHSKITLLHVIPDDIENEKVKRLLDEAAMNQMDSINEQIEKEGVKINKPIVLYGGYSEKIVQASNDIKANIIILGSGEKSKKDKFQLGTTAETVIRMSNIPVWIIKKGSDLKIEKIFCPVDFSLESKRALTNANILARRFKAKLIVLSVYDKLNRPSIQYDWKEENKTQKQGHKVALDNFLTDFNFVDLEYEKKVKGGDPAKVILKEIKKTKPDFLIMGTTGKTALSRFIMGSVTEKVIREVPCSFMTLKTKDVVSLKLDERIQDIEKHYAIAIQLMKDGFFNESIDEFKYCLSINVMHIPSLKGLATIYAKLGNTNMSEKYTKTAREVMTRIWDEKIELEIRNIRFKK